MQTNWQADVNVLQIIGEDTPDILKMDLTSDLRVFFFLIV